MYWETFKMSAENVIYEKLCLILSKELSVERQKISPESLIKDDLGADSLDIAELAMVIRDEFTYDLTEEEISTMKKVSDLAGVLSRHKKIQS